MKYPITIFFLFFVLFFFSFQIVKNQDVFVYQNIPDKYKSSKGNLGKTNLISQKTRDASYSIVNSLPDGYDKQAKTDYTDLIQSVLDTHNNVTFPGFPLLVNSKGLTLKSNSQIIFNKGSKLLMEANSKKNYEILRLHEITNVILYSPTIIGDREAHIGTTGEWGFGISIRGSQTIKVLNAVVKNCWGDGIYIGSIGSLPNSDILIENSFLDNNRRNGISIISGTNVSIVNSLISNTNGTLPMSGIDLEPNSNQEILKNINLHNIITFNNKENGLLIVLRALQGKNVKEINVNVKNHIDDGSSCAMAFGLPNKTNNDDFKSISGRIDVINSVWKNNKIELVRVSDYINNKINISFVKPQVVSNNNSFSQKKMGKLKAKCEKGKNFLLTE